MEKTLFTHDGKNYSFSDVVKAIRKVGIIEGDIVFVHTDLSKFGRLSGITDRHEFNSHFLNACLNAIGEKGTLVVPTFSYSFGDEFGAKKFFDVENTPSILNYFTEVARKTKGFRRSDDPMLSVVCKGPHTNDLIANLSSRCLGKGSIWERLHKMNAHNLMLGFKFDSTFIHYVEEKFNAPYRHNIELQGKIKKDEKEFQKNIIYFARKRESKVELNREKLYHESLNSGALKITNLGAGKVMSIKSKDLFSIAGKMTENDPYSLVTLSPNINRN